MPATEHAVQELQRLVALLENSGAAHRRADVQALLEASRQALGDVALPRRAAGTGRDKLRRLATLALDGAALLLVLIGTGAPAPFLAAAAWAGFRLRHRAGLAGRGVAAPAGWAGLELGLAGRGLHRSGRPPLRRAGGGAPRPGRLAAPRAQPARHPPASRMSRHC
jgi:hypothetical protein